MIQYVLIKSHSGLRYLVLAAMILAVIQLIKILISGKGKAKVIVLSSMILLHIQLVIGLILYLTSQKIDFSHFSMKDSLQRFYHVEHISMMLVAAALFTWAYMRSKKLMDTQNGARKMLIYLLIALLVILLAIPWPFRGLGNVWI